MTNKDQREPYSAAWVWMTVTVYTVLGCLAAYAPEVRWGL